jgi:hypothetical protein
MPHKLRLLLLITLFAASACKAGGGTQACDVGDSCEDGDGCTNDVCASGQCQHTPVTDNPDCVFMCSSSADCNDGDDCTTNVCDEATNSCRYPDNGTCGDPCNDDAGCQGHPCETGICNPSGQCDYTPISNPACDMCANDDACDDAEPCFCNDCQNASRCSMPADCVEFTVSNVDNFGEGDIVLLDGGDIEGAGSDIWQAFDQYADSATENTAITDHGTCFNAGVGCNQLRVNFDTTPIEFMATSGSWLHEAGNTGGVAGVAYREYTQVGQAMTYVPGGKCYWIDYAYYP